MDQGDEERLAKRLGWRLIPLLTVLYLAAYIDRQNVGFAKLQMLADLRMSEAAYGLGASLFFIGYFLFEVPSTLCVHKFGARAWLARIMFTWGLVTLLMGVTTSASMFYVLRFLLGVAEAGFYPGVIYYLTLWFTRSHRVWVVGFFTLGSSLGNMCGAMFGGPLLALDGAFGFHGWQWVFFGTGVPAIALTGAVLAWLPSTPESAKFLSVKEKSVLRAMLDRDASPRATAGNPFAVFWDLRIWGFSSIDFCIAGGIYCINYWLPTVVASFGIGATANGAINMIPWALASLLLIGLPRFLKTDAAVRRGVLLLTAFGTIGFVASTLVPWHWACLAVIALATPALPMMLPCFWALPPRYFTGARAAASIAAINSIGNLGGFVAQNLDPWLYKLSGNIVVPMMAPGFCLAFIGIAAAIWYRRVAGARALVPVAVPAE